MLSAQKKFIKTAKNVRAERNISIALHIYPSATEEIYMQEPVVV